MHLGHLWRMLILIGTPQEEQRRTGGLVFMSWVPLSHGSFEDQNTPS